MRYVLLIISIGLFLNLPCHSEDLDMVDYYATMATTAENEADLQEALSQINTGLKEYPGNKRLLEIKNRLEKMQAKLDAAERKKAAAAAEQEKKEQQQAEARSIERRERGKGRPYCACVDYKSLLLEQKEKELQIGATSGFVNKVRLYNIGEKLVLIDNYFAATYPGGPPDGTQCSEATRGYSRIALAEICTERLATFQQKSLGF